LRSRAQPLQPAQPSGPYGAVTSTSRAWSISNSSGAEEAERLSGAVKATATGWHRGYRRLEVQSLYSLDRADLKLVLTGDLPGIIDLLEMIQLLAGYRR
jgi:hypothetical protein